MIGLSNSEPKKPIIIWKYNTAPRIFREFNGFKEKEWIILIPIGFKDKLGLINESFLIYQWNDYWVYIG